jgi:hypothetical protein
LLPQPARGTIFHHLPLDRPRLDWLGQGHYKRSPYLRHAKPAGEGARTMLEPIFTPHHLILHYRNGGFLSSPCDADKKKRPSQDPLRLAGGLSVERALGEFAFRGFEAFACARVPWGKSPTRIKGCRNQTRIQWGDPKKKVRNWMSYAYVGLDGKHCSPK